MFATVRSLSISVLGKGLTDLLAFCIHITMFFWVIQIFYRLIRDVRSGRKKGYNLGIALAVNFSPGECRFIANDPACNEFIRAQIKAFQDYESRSYTVDYNEIYRKVLAGIFDVPSFKAYRSVKVRSELMAIIEAHRAEKVALEAGTLKVLTPYNAIKSLPGSTQPLDV